MALQSEWPGSGPASLLMCYLQQVKGPPLHHLWSGGGMGINVPSLEGQLL